jgi:hypothetical protein
MIWLCCLNYFGPQKGVRDIAGKLRKLNAPEKRQLLAILRERDDCPVGWKNIDPKKQLCVLGNLYKAIEKLLNPEEFKKKQQAYNDRNHKRRKENGQQKADNDRNHKKRKESGEAQAYAKRRRESGEAQAYAKRRKESGEAQAYAKRRRESGEQKANSDRQYAKVSQARREIYAQAILENQDHKEDTWDEDTLERLATEIVEMIVEKCGPDGFVHVCGGAWPGMTVNEAVEAECFGKGRNRHAVFIDGGKFVRYRDVSEYVELFTPYFGTNCLNADELEKRVQKKLIDMGWPAHRRMFVHAGKGSCKGTRAAEIPLLHRCVGMCSINGRNWYSPCYRTMHPKENVLPLPCRKE